MKRRIVQHYYDWLIERCGWCGLRSHWATDGKGNLFCADCKH